MKVSLFPRGRAGFFFAFALCLLGLLIGSPRIADAQQNWTKQTGPHGYGLLGVYFSAARNGTAVGIQGTILRTTDGGAAWTPQNSGVWDSLNAVFFTDLNTGTVAGDSGVILRTTDGGATWSRQSSGTEVQLMGVSFADASTGIVVGRDGTILRTTDGGAHWVRQDSRTYNDLFGVFCSEAANGIAVGARGTILRTTDGGATWKKQANSTRMDLKAVSFSDASKGLAVGSGGIILRTADGGQSWTAQQSGTLNWLESVSFVGGKFGFAVGNATILQTTDGGATWSRLPAGALEGLQAVSFADANSGVAVGLNGVILRATSERAAAASEAAEARHFLDQQLYEAVRDNQIEKLRELIQKGADPDGPGDVWPLSDAVAKGSVEMVRILLAAGAGVDAMKNPNPGRDSSMTPLRAAAQGGYTEIIRLLVAAGAKVNAGSPGNSALWWAAANQRAAAARALIEAGADLKAEIAFAQSRRWGELVAKLKEYGGKVPAPQPLSPEALVKKLDALDAVRWSTLAAQNKEMLSAEEIASARAELDARVKAHPDDMKALLLWARLTPQAIIEVKSGNPDFEGPLTKVDDAALHAALDRILQAEPNNAQAHYQKGLLYGKASERYRLFEASPKSMDLAIQHVRKAVGLEPKRASFRQTLAIFLAAAGKASEGKEILTRALGERHPMVALMSDLATVGVPEGAEYFPWHTISMFGFVALGERNINDYVELRLRTYRLSMTPESLEAFYRVRFPSFKFFLEEEKKPDKQKEATAEEGRAFMQYFRWKDGGWKPSLNMSEIPNLTAPQDGLLLLFLELDPKMEAGINGKTAPDAAHPEQPGRYLVLLNYRTTK